MAYCDYELVGTLLEVTFSSTSKPTSTKVTELINVIASEINMTLLSKGITVPSPDENFYSLLKLMNAYGTAGIVGMTYSRNAESVVNTLGADYKKDYKDFIASIKKDPDQYKQVVKTGIASTHITDGYTDESVLDNSIGDDWTA